MLYKYELHCHTGEVSRCADAPAAKIVELYKRKNYNGIVITDHYSPMTFPISKVFCPQKAADFYLSGYRAAKAAAGEGLVVLLGMEVRFYATANDYLVYGMTEDFVKNSGNILAKRAKSFYEMTKKSGMLLVQAHPFRGYVSRMNPAYLDGAEVFNGKSKDKEENEKSRAWAEENNMKIITSGSDFHHLTNKINGGIQTDEPIKTNEDLLRILKNKTYELICDEI